MVLPQATIYATILNITSDIKRVQNSCVDSDLRMDHMSPKHVA
jgi:hypothetical protein